MVFAGGAHDVGAFLKSFSVFFLNVVLSVSKKCMWKISTSFRVLYYSPLVWMLNRQGAHYMYEAKLYDVQTSALTLNVESCWCHLFETSLSFRNNTFGNKTNCPRYTTGDNGISSYPRMECYTGYPP